MDNMNVSEQIPGTAAIEGAIDAEIAPRRRSRGSGPGTFMRLLVASRSGLVGTAIVLVVVIAGVLAPAIARHNPNEQDLIMVTVPPVWEDGGSPEYLIGTDNLGRDLLSRLLYGAQVSLLVAVVAVLLSGSVGVLLGLVSGFFGGRVDNLLMAIAEVQLAFPFILLAIAIISVLGPSLENTVLALAIASWVSYARIVRAETLSQREREYITAALALGASNARVLFRHLLPLMATPILVVATLEIARMIVIESALSFLGLGVQPPRASWGSMVADGRDYLLIAWWLSVFPGLAITLTVMGVNLLGDWLRDAFDPRLRKAR
jgi:peptide/nickel transport system permease protein